MSSKAAPEQPIEENGAYQISFEVENCGKTVEQSKKRVTWIYGVGGKDCKITLLWSKLSGKRFIFVDDEEVYSEERKAATLCTSG